MRSISINAIGRHNDDPYPKIRHYGKQKAASDFPKEADMSYTLHIIVESISEITSIAMHF